MRWLALAVAALVLASPADSRTWYITPDGTGDAVTTQAAVDSALTGDVIELADGIYSGSGFSDVSIVGRPTLQALTIRSTSGQSESCIIDCSGDTGFVCYNLGAGAEFNGLSFRYSNSGSPSLSCAGGAVAVTDCEFALCQGDVGQGPLQIYNAEFHAANLVVRDNYAAGPAGIHVEDSTGLVEGCNVYGNSTEHSGGGIWIEGTSAVTIRDCVVMDNYAAIDGGGIYYQHTGDEYLEIENCQLTGNVAGGDGGAIAGQKYHCRDSVIAGNLAFGSGGAIRALRGSIVRTLVVGNEALGVGGAIYCRSRAGGYPADEFTVEGCTIASNRASDIGGGIFVDTANDVHVLETVFDGNCAPLGPDGAVLGGGEITMGCTIANPAMLLTLGGGSLVLDTTVLSASPQFCSPSPCGLSSDHEYRYGVQNTSPCLPANNPCGVLLGALSQGCGPVAIESRTWGHIKAAFR